MNDRFIAVVLAGGIRPAPLARAIGLPPLALPVEPGRTLLDLWIERLSETGCAGMRVVVSREDDAESLHAVIARRDEGGLPVAVQLEAARWRGTAGLLRDLVAGGGDAVLLVEGACLPPDDLGPLVAADGPAVARVGVVEGDRPSGQYWFRPEVLAEIPPIGFHDVKEQVLPALHASGRAARAVALDGAACRLRDLEDYLQAIALRAEPASGFRRSVSAHRRVGACLVAEDAVVGPGAVLHECAVLDGARIGAGAVVSRAVVGPGASVAPGAVVRDRMIAAGEGAPTLVGAAAARGATG